MLFTPKYLDMKIKNICDFFDIFDIMKKRFLNN